MRAMHTDDHQAPGSSQRVPGDGQNQPERDDRSSTDILVWDLPTRIFHWLFAGSFAIAWLTAESERTRHVHVTAGYTFGALLLFRLYWGFKGSRTARFSDFVRGPKAVIDYLTNLMTDHPRHFTGHNPAGGWAILGLLLLGALTTLTGWVSYEELSDLNIGEWHETIASVMLGLIALHIAAVLLSGIVHHENLVRAMLTGKKRAPSADGIAHTHRIVGLTLLVAALTFWIWSFA